MDTIEIFDPKDFTFRMMSEKLPETYLDMGLVAFGGKILVLGGRVFPGWIDKDFVYEIDPLTETVSKPGLKKPVPIYLQHVKLYNI